MKTIIGAVILVTASSAWAERHPIKPLDFTPLTEVPWKRSDASLDEVLAAIYLEPNLTVRREVLGKYLHLIPAELLGSAFDICVQSEGTNSPDILIDFFLPIWAQRDPAGCWERVQKLFHLVGIEWGTLGYDSWDHPITVHDRAAIQAAGYWIQRDTLKRFPLAVEKSDAPEEERVRIMKAFADTWFAAFKIWPGYPHQRANLPSGDPWPEQDGQIVRILELPPIVELTQYVGMDKPDSAAAYDVALRKRVKADPKSAPEIVEKAREEWFTKRQQKEWSLKIPSNELLMIWAQADLAGLLRWIETLENPDEDMVVRVRGFLMSRVDAKTRDRWRKEAHGKEGAEAELMTAWAAWNPEAALLAAAESGAQKVINRMGVAAGYGPWWAQPCNSTLFGLGVIERFDFSKFGQRDPFAGDGYNLGELWGDVDPGASARFHLDYLLRTHYAPREKLIAFLSGQDIYGGEDGMIDRGFCAMRVWAVVAPEEMKAWIATRDDSEMQKALMWLVEHPWGHEPEK